jgi:hypothetical protein
MHENWLSFVTCIKGKVLMLTSWKLVCCISTLSHTEAPSFLLVTCRDDDSHLKLLQYAGVLVCPKMNLFPA